MKEKLEFIYRGGKTKRFHTEQVVCPQNVAEHSFGVVWMVMLVHPSARKELLLAALAHDLAEHKVGDVPSPTKKAYPMLKDALDIAESAMLRDNGFDFENNLTDHEARVLKVADMLDGMMFCVNEKRMGSKAIVPVWNNFSAYARSVPNLWPEATDLINVIHNLWENV